MNVSNAVHSNITSVTPAGVIQFPGVKRSQTQANKGWVCNLSKQYQFSQQHHSYLQIPSSKKHSQFELICGLLKADTCEVIYFDDQLSANQLDELRKHHVNSQTELMHAKVAHFFTKSVSTLYS